MKKKNVDYTNWSKDELIKELKRIKETTYGLVWHRDVPQEKIDVLINPDARTPEEMFANEVAGKPFPVLKEVKGKDVVSDKNDQTHILIEGDNYHSLAVLNFTHQEAIDVIYIDPPYNTGNNDFIYTDKFNSEYVKKEDPFRHSKWLSFMEKRLKLAHYLLKNTGVIFISINDIELYPLKMLCDEIFNEENFVANLVWSNKEGGGSSDSKNFRIKHEYILVYAKEHQKLSIKNVDITNEDRYKLEDKHVKIRGKYYLQKLNQASIQYSKSLDYPVVTPDGTKIFPAQGTKRACWRWSQKKLDWGLENDFVEFKKDSKGQWQLYSKQYLKVDNEGNPIERSNPPFGIIEDFSSTYAAKQLEQIFNKKVFDYSKPTPLIQYLLDRIANKNATILDFMAGSGTTGHAVLDLNNEDGGNRKFILCTNNENDIATEVCQPRLQKVMKGYRNSKGEKIEGLGGNLKYFTAYDFVESEPSDKNKHKLVNKCTEMLCIKEGIYDLVIETDDYKIFKSNDDRYLGIIFYEDAIDEYKEAIKKIDSTINTYVFSLGDDPHTAQFADVTDKVALQAIPEIILKVYQEIFR